MIVLGMKEGKIFAANKIDGKVKDPQFIDSDILRLLVKLDGRVIDNDGRRYAISVIESDIPQQSVAKLEFGAVSPMGNCKVMRKLGSMPTEEEFMTMVEESLDLYAEAKAFYIEKYEGDHNETIAYYNARTGRMIRSPYGSSAQAPAVEENLAEKKPQKRKKK